MRLMGVTYDLPHYFVSCREGMKTYEVKAAMQQGQLREVSKHAYCLYDPRHIRPQNYVQT